MSGTDPIDPSDLTPLQTALGHRFAEIGRLVEALTHSSVGGMDRSAVGQHYERLEFLGDRVLGLVIAEWLLERFPKEAEGALARRHTALVRAEALTVVARRIDLGRYLRMASSERDQAGNVKAALLADACEAVIGALFLDGGLEAARRFIRIAWADAVEAPADPPQDAKTALQEWAMARGRALPVYETLGRSGPDHAPLFEVRVSVAGLDPVTATGTSKRAAEKLAATELLRRIGTQTT